MVNRLGVSDLRPTVSKLLTVPAVTVETFSTQTIAVPLGMLDRVVVFVPPGCNYSVGVGIGFNNRKLIPTESTTEYIYGPGFQHEFQAGWQVQGNVDVFFKQRNLYQHRIWVGLYITRLDLSTTSTFLGPT